MRNPRAVAGHEHWLERSNQSARRNYRLNLFAISLMDVGFTIRHYKQPPAVEASLNLHGQPVRRPQGFTGFPQSSLVFCGRPGLAKTFRQRHHFPSQRFEQIQIRHLLMGRNSAHAKSAHPLRGSCDGSGYAPSHNQHRDENDEKDLDQHPKECFAPGTEVLCPNVIDIMHHRQPAQHFIVPVQRYRKDVYPIFVQPAK